MKSAMRFRAWTLREKREGPVRELDPEKSVQVQPNKRDAAKDRAEGSRKTHLSVHGFFLLLFCCIRNKSSGEQLCGFIWSVVWMRTYAHTNPDFSSTRSRLLMSASDQPPPNVLASLANNFDLEALD